jgi:hypothetical protein
MRGCRTLHRADIGYLADGTIGGLRIGCVAIVGCAIYCDLCEVAVAFVGFWDSRTQLFKYLPLLTSDMHTCHEIKMMGFARINSIDHGLPCTRRVTPTPRAVLKDWCQ